MEKGNVDLVLVDDLSRLTRDVGQLLELIKVFKYRNANLIAIADNIDTRDERSKIGYQIKGVFNELLLDDLRNKTVRGMTGQLRRGYFVGETAIGYLPLYRHF